MPRTLSPDWYWLWLVETAAALNDDDDPIPLTLFARLNDAGIIVEDL